MRKIILTFVLVLVSLAFYAQSVQNITLSVLTEPLPEPFPVVSETILKNNLNKLILKNGIAQRNSIDRFFITAVATPLTKDILGAAPTQFAYTLDITFYIADIIDQKVFSTASVNSKGVGKSEDKAIIDALKRVNLNNSTLLNFVEDGKKKIVAYYDEQAPAIIKKANLLAGMEKYEEALYTLISIPSECKSYDEAISLQLDIYQKYIDHLCDVNLSKAKMAWAAEQNSLGATEAGEYLSEIYPDAKCYKEAQQLYDEIKSKVLDDWKFEMKIYQDGVDLESQRINAIRDIGVAYGEGQQPTSTYIGWIR